MSFSKKCSIQQIQSNYLETEGEEFIAILEDFPQKGHEHIDLSDLQILRKRSKYAEKSLSFAVCTRVTLFPRFTSLSQSLQNL